MVSKRRQKILKKRSDKKMSKLHSYRERESLLPDPQTKYGKRWHARRAGKPMSARHGEPLPWWDLRWSVSGLGHVTLEQIRRAKEKAAMSALAYVEVSN